MSPRLGELKQEGAGAFPGKGHLRPDEAELKRLHGELSGCGRRGGS